jgi:hypothetical protein
VLKKSKGKKDITDKKIGEIIDKKTDHLKELLFKVSVFIIFFFAAPLAVFLILNIGAIRMISW